MAPDEFSRPRVQLQSRNSHPYRYLEGSSTAGSVDYFILSAVASSRRAYHRHIGVDAAEEQ